MNWDAIGAIAELLGAGAVVVTLVFLIGQLRTNNRLLRAESLRFGTRASMETGLAIASDRHVAEVFAKGLADPESLDSTDKGRFMWLMSSLVTAQHATHQERELGLATRAEGGNLAESMRAILDTPGGRWFWQRVRGSYQPGFVEAVESTFSMDARAESATPKDARP